MPRPGRRSRTLRRIFRKTPSGKSLIAYKRRKPKKARCAICGKALKGVPRELPFRMKNLAKSKKRPSRIYGGYLCSSCTRRKIIEELRK